MAFTPAGRQHAIAHLDLRLHGRQALSITDPAGRTTAFTVDGAGHLVAGHLPGRRDPEWRDPEFAYDSRGLLTQQTNQRGEVTSYTYDAYGRIRSAMSPPRARSSTPPPARPR